MIIRGILTRVRIPRMIIGDHPWDHPFPDVRNDHFSQNGRFGVVPSPPRALPETNEKHRFPYGFHWYSSCTPFYIKGGTPFYIKRGAAGIPMETIGKPMLFIGFWQGPGWARNDPKSTILREMIISHVRKWMIPRMITNDHPWDPHPGEDPTDDHW